jgi:hypothetical protein
MLKTEGKVAEIIIEKMMSWLPARLCLEERHSGFNVYCGNAVCPHNQVRPDRRKLGEWNLSVAGIKLV